MKKNHVILAIILLLAGFLRFYNLMFDAPYFFNPDEKNMAYAITQLRFPNQFNPHFFAYGQFPLYLAYFSFLLLSFFLLILQQSASNLQFITLSQAVFSLRFWSAATSTFTVFLVFLITRKLIKFTRLALIATLFCAMLPGLIQSAHFGTTESLLTFFYTMTVYLCLLFNEKTTKMKYVIYLGIVLGLAASTKVSALIFSLLPLTIVFLDKEKFSQKIIHLLIIFGLSLFVFAFTSPFNFLDFAGFRNSLNYESAVALGKTKVFYTRQFETTIPVVFQIEKILPYTLGWPIFIMGTAGFILMSINSIRKRNKAEWIVLWAFLIYFLSNALLYVKWTRFITPIFPLFALFATFLLVSVFRIYKNIVLKSLLVFISLIPGLVFFTIYLHPDTRIQASEWIYQNIASNSYVLSETANVVDIPLYLTGKEQVRNYHLSPVSFNFYDLDYDPQLKQELKNHLEKADYIFVPSRRIFTNLYPVEKYPLTNKYYELLFSGGLGFKEVAKFSFLSDEQAEETFTVFDHPVIRIYKKMFNPDEGYERLLNEK